MRKLWMSAFCAAGLLLAGEAFAADVTKEAAIPQDTEMEMEAAKELVLPDGKGTAEISEEDGAWLSKMVSASLSDGAFMDSKKLAETVSYEAFHHPTTGELLPVGQLQVSKDGRDMVAEVLAVKANDPHLDAYFGGIYTPNVNGNISPECMKTLDAFNQKLVAMPLAANAGTISIIGTIREMTGKDIPYSALYTDFRSVESLHLVRAPGRIATTGTRIFAYVDGWVFPMYVKAYMWKTQTDGYRFLFAVMEDNEKADLLKATEDLALSIALGR
jgi:hypothetical protein